MTKAKERGVEKKEAEDDGRVNQNCLHGRMMTDDGCFLI